MCSECLSTPCHPRCPNAPDPEPLYECAYCDGGIYAGEKMVRIDGVYFHLSCLKDMDIEELMELVDVDVEEAADDD